MNNLSGKRTFSSPWKERINSLFEIWTFLSPWKESMNNLSEKRTFSSPWKESINSLFEIWTFLSPWKESVNNLSGIRTLSRPQRNQKCISMNRFSWMSTFSWNSCKVLLLYRPGGKKDQSRNVFVRLDISLKSRDNTTLLKQNTS